MIANALRDLLVQDAKAMLMNVCQILALLWELKNVFN